MSDRLRHVVVVEDEPTNAALIRKVLEKRGGHRVSVTEDPLELLEWTRSGDVDLVVMDVSLAHSRWEGERVSGVDLCRMLKEDPRTTWIPVLLATAHAMRGDAESLLAESGADDYVAKPITDHAAFIAQVGRLFREAA